MVAGLEDGEARNGGWLLAPAGEEAEAMGLGGSKLGGLGEEALGSVVGIGSSGSGWRQPDAGSGLDVDVMGVDSGQDGSSVGSSSGGCCSVEIGGRTRRWRDRRRQHRCVEEWIPVPAHRGGMGKRWPWRVGGEIFVVQLRCWRESCLVVSAATQVQPLSKAIAQAVNGMDQKRKKKKKKKEKGTGVGSKVKWALLSHM